MTQKVNPSEFRPAEAFKTAGAIALAGGSSDGWISSSSSPSDLSVQDTGVTESNLNAFSASTSSSSLDVTIDGGEAFIYGSWVVKDSTSTITLDASTSDQTVYVGWDKNGTDQVIVGLESAFETEADNTDEKIELYEFDTDSTGVTNSNDLREIGQYHKLSHAEIADQLDIPVYSELSNAPSNEGSIVVIDGSGSDVEGAYRYDGTSYDKIGNTNEEIEDIVNSLLQAGTGITLDYDDANDTLTISGFDGDHSSLTNVQSDQHHTRYSDEEAQDAVGTITSGGDKVSVTYDDTANTITIDTSALDSEEVEDQVNSLLQAGTGITLDYDDANDTLTISGFDGDHSSLTNVQSDQHHTRYDDVEARNAVTGNVDAADLEGSSGSTGQVLTTDGNTANWSDSFKSDIDLIDVNDTDGLPDPSTLSNPTIAYIDSQDEYIGIFQD